MGRASWRRRSFDINLAYTTRSSRSSPTALSLERADLGHHVVADALERAQHQLMVAENVAHHHVVEPHLAIRAQSRHDGGGAPNEQLVKPRAAIALGEDGVDDRARVLVGVADVDV